MIFTQQTQAVNGRDVYKRQDIDIVSTAKKLDANDVFIYSAIIHISASKYCISNTAVT